MAVSKEGLFRLFTLANDLIIKPIFGTGIVYIGEIFREPVSRETTESSLEFAGFCDGYQGKHHRYQGPRRTSLRKRSSSLGDIMDRATKNFSPKNREELVRMALEAEEAIPEERYSTQYSLGSQVNCRR